LDGLGNEFGNSCNVYNFKAVKILGTKYNKVLSWGIKMFKIQRS